MPAVAEPDAARAEFRGGQRGRAIGGGECRQRDFRPHTDHGRVQVDEDRRDLRQLDAETPPVGGGEGLVQARDADIGAVDADRQDVALPLELHVGRQDAAQLAYRHALAPDRGLALGRLLGIDARHRGVVDGGQGLVHRAHVIVAQVGHDAAQRIGDAGSRRHQHRGNAQLAGQRGRVQGAGAAEGEQREVARVMAA